MNLPMFTMLALRERPERLTGVMARIAALLCSDSTAPRRPEMVLPRVAIAMLLLWPAVTSRVAAVEPAGFRRLGPGTLTVIPADKTTDDALQRADVVEITQGKADLTWTPQMAPAVMAAAAPAKGAAPAAKGAPAPAAKAAAPAAAVPAKK